MCSFRQGAEQLVLHTFREFFLISGYTWCFSGLKTSASASGNYHFQKKNERQKTKYTNFILTFIQHPVLYSVFIYVFVNLQQY